MEGTLVVDIGVTPVVVLVAVVVVMVVAAVVMVVVDTAAIVAVAEVIMLVSLWMLSLKPNHKTNSQALWIMMLKCRWCKLRG